MRKNLSLISLLMLSLWLSVAAYAQAPSGYYKSAEGKKQAALLSALCSIVGPHTNVGYNGLWDVYEDSDVRPGTSIVWDMYSTAQFKINQKKCGNYSHIGDCYNREHSFPKSWFDDASPMVSDAFHIYPTDGKVNGQRSNYPYGECANGTKVASYNGIEALGKLGACTFSGYTGTVFEPDDEYKGDFARTYFYMAACYNDKIANWSSPMLAGNSYPCYKTWAINLLMKWNAQDPVSQKEIDRNNAIYKHQKNRNPFIDHPELADYIWGSMQDVAWTEGGAVVATITSPANGDNIDMGVAAINTTISKTITVKGSGLTDAVTVTVSGTGFKASKSTISASDVNGGTTMMITYTSASAAEATGTLTLTSGSVKSTVVLKAQAVDGIPALAATDVTQNSFTAHWTNLDKNTGAKYNLTVFASDGTTVLNGYPVEVVSANQQYSVTGLDYNTTYYYQLSNAAGMTSNVVSVTTEDLDRTIVVELPDGFTAFTAAPGVDSDPIEVEIYAENIPENEITVTVSGGFQVSTDKNDWRTEVSVESSAAETMGATVYVRRPASSAGTYTGTLAAYTETVEGEDVNLSAVITEPITFFEDFEPEGDAPYSTFTYQGTACKWDIVKGGLCSRSADKFNGKQGVCTAKSGERSITMLADKNDGAGVVTFYAAPYGSDSGATLELSYSVDHGSNWIVLQSFEVDNKTTLEECTATANIAQPVRFRLVETEGARVNIDDFKITSYSSSVATVDAAAKWDAYCLGGKLIIETAVPSQVSVYTLDAREAYSSTVSGTAAVSLPAGLYIVVLDNDSRKVVVK